MSSSDESPRSGVSPLVFWLCVVLFVGVVAGLLYVMGIRRDTPLPEPSPASEVEVSRQASAMQLTRLSSAATEMAGTDAENAAFYDALANHSATHLETVGGVWVPWPDGPPEGATNPPLETDIPNPVTPEILGAELVATRDAVEAQLLETSSDDAPRYASMLIRYELDVREFERLTGIPADGGTADATPIAPLTTDEFAAKVHDGVTVERLETARQWFEVVAARSAEPHEFALASRDHLGALVNAMLDAGAPDTRPAVAPLPDWFFADPLAPEALPQLADSARSLIVEQAVFLAGQVEPADRRAVVDLALSYLAEPRFASEMGAYPGLVEP